MAESVKERGQLKYYFHHKSVAWQWQISNTLYSGKLQRKHCYDRKIAYVMMPVIRQTTANSSMPRQSKTVYLLKCKMKKSAHQKENDDSQFLQIYNKMFIICPFTTMKICQTA